MCHYFEITYACGHSDMFEGPCEWREEGMVNEQGENHGCTKSCSTETDFERSCLECSRHEFSGKVSVMEIIVRNEAFLRKRERRGGSFQSRSAQHFVSPSQHELEVQFLVNKEFLSRRYKRKCFQRHLDSAEISYQDVSEAALAHIEAKTALNNNTFSVQDAAKGIRPHSPHGSTDHVGYQAEILDPEYGVQHEYDTLSPSDDRRAHHELGSDSESEYESEEDLIPRPLNLARLLGDGFELHSYQPRREDREGNSADIVSTGDAQPDETPTKPPLERSQSRREFPRGAINQDSSSSNSSTTSSDDGDLHTLVHFESPEGISNFAECRKFLGLPLDASPAHVFNVFSKDKAIRLSIFENTLPPHHHPHRPGRRPKFKIEGDRFLKMIIDDDESWQMRKSFSRDWNSLDWVSRNQYRPPESVDVEEWIDDIEDQELASSAAPEGQSSTIPAAAVPLDMTVATVRYSINLSGTEQRPQYLPTAVSPLRVSLTYAEPSSTPNEVSHFSDSSSSSSSTSDGSGELPPEHREEGNKQSVDKGHPESANEEESRNKRGRNSHQTQRDTGLVSADSPYGQALLTGLCKVLAFPLSRETRKLSLFIDENDSLMDAIRLGDIPHPEIKRNKEVLRVRMEIDSQFALMRSEFFHTLTVLDWDEIDMAHRPVKNKLSAKPQGLAWHDEARAQGLRRRIATPLSAELGLNKMKGYKEYRVKVWSPLRWSYTRTENPDESNSSSSSSSDDDDIDDDPFLDAFEAFEDKDADPELDPDSDANEAPGSELRWVLYNSRQKLDHATRQHVQSTPSTSLNPPRQRDEGNLDSDLDEVGGDSREEDFPSEDEGLENGMSGLGIFYSRHSHPPERPERSPPRPPDEQISWL